MNNAAILAGGTVIFARTLAGLRAAVAAATGEAPSLGARPEVAEFIAAIGPTWTTAYLLTPEAIRGGGGDPAVLLGGRTPEEVAAIATRIAENAPVQAAMPRPELVAVGITAGGPLPSSLRGSDATPALLPPGTPQAAGVIALRFADRASADLAAGIVDARLREATSLVANVPYREFFPSWELRVTPDSPTLIVSLASDPPSRPDRVVQLLFQRDVLFVSW